jgi:hypothetical protein
MTGPAGEQGIQGPIGPNGTQGPQGIQGERGFNGTNGVNGTQGPPGVTFINSTNTYHLQALSNNFTTEGVFVTTVFLECSPEDFVISGGFGQTSFLSDAITISDTRVGTNAWIVNLKSTTDFQPFVGTAECFDNPPLEP